MFKSEKGFTLIEILLVIGLIAILAAIVIIAINPARQFAQARNTQRASNVNAILNAVHENMIDNEGVWTCTTSLPTTSQTIDSSTTDIYSCLVDIYLAELPYDPETGYFTSESDYDTGYSIVVSTSTGRVTVSAPDAELSDTVSVTR